MNPNLPSHFPLRRTFLVFERLLRDIDTPAGHLMILMVLVAVGCVGAALQIHGAQKLGEISLYALLMRLALTRHLKILSRALLVFLELKAAALGLSLKGSSPQNKEVC